MNELKQNAADFTIEKTKLGMHPNGHAVNLYRINASDGSYLELSDLGARMTRLGVADKHGKIGNVLQDFDTLDLWLTTGKNHGAICGRFANRLGGASFQLGEDSYRLGANEKGNTLHGGLEGFNAKLWSAEEVDAQTLCFTYVSADGEEGFPGELTATVRYHFDGKRVSIEEKAVSDKDTVVGLTNHAYFQLAGPAPEQTVLEQTLKLEADFYTVVDEALLPTGEIRPVAGSAFDFRTAKAIGQDIAASEEQISFGGGYDHNFVLRKDERKHLELAATLHDPASGRTMTCSTTKPGIQVYTANATSVDPVSERVIYGLHGAVCLETQGFPNSMQRTHFPSPILRAGETYEELTVYEFFN